MELNIMFEKEEFNLHRSTINRKYRRYGSRTLLHMAALEGKVHKILKLINYNVDPFITDISNRTALYYATTKNHRLCSRLLMRNMRKRKFSKKNILINVDKIIRNGDHRTLKILLNDSIFIEGRYKPLWKIIDNDDVYMLRLVLLYYKKQKTEKLNYTIRVLIFYAIGQKSNDCCIYLLSHVDDVNECFLKFKNTYIQCSTEYNNYKITEYLLETRDSTPNTITMNFCFPLGNALKNKNKKMIDLLLRNNANVHLLSFKLEETFKFGHEDLIIRTINILDIEYLYECLLYTKKNVYINLIKERILQMWTPFLVKTTNYNFCDTFGIIESFLLPSSISTTLFPRSK